MHQRFLRAMRANGVAKGPLRILGPSDGKAKKYFHHFDILFRALIRQKRAPFPRTSLRLDGRHSDSPHEEMKRHKIV